MRAGLLLIVIGLGWPATWPQKVWLVRQDSSIHIFGKTNVADFQCDAQRYSSRDTLVLQERVPGARAFFEKGTLRMRIRLFDCHNTLLTEDFRQTLQAEKCPELVIHLLHFDHMPTLASTDETVTGRLRVVLAGVAKEFEMKFNLKTSFDRSLQLYGNRRMSFSDFNLTPPQKMMGMVQAEDAITVAFTLQLVNLN